MAKPIHTHIHLRIPYNGIKSDTYNSVLLISLLFPNKPNKVNLKPGIEWVMIHWEPYLLCMKFNKGLLNITTYRY